MFLTIKFPRESRVASNNPENTKPLYLSLFLHVGGYAARRATEENTRL